MSEASLQRKYFVSYKQALTWDAKRQDSGFVVGDKLSKIITQKVWSPIIYRDGIRNQSNFLSSDWCVFDFDEHKDIAQVAKELIDYKYIIAPTKSHTDTHHRYRVAIPFERTITNLEEYRYNMKMLVDEYEADPQCKDGARFFWPSKSIYAVNVEGDLMPVKEQRHKRVFEPIKLNRATDPQIPARVIKYLTEGVAEGTRNETLWTISKDLYQQGFEWEDIRKIVHKVPTSPAYKESEYDAIVRSARRSVEKG